MSTDIEQHSRPTSGYKTFTTAVVCTSCALRDKLSYKPRKDLQREVKAQRFKI